MAIIAETSNNERLGRLYQHTPLPRRAIMIGTVKRETGEEGALVLLDSGNYVQMNAGVIRMLPQYEIQ
jgi:hypothetical protein